MPVGSEPVATFKDVNGTSMGFNATRRYRDKKTVDIALLIAAVLIVLALLAWVFAAGGS
jgi:hypothetical protein